MISFFLFFNLLISSVFFIYPAECQKNSEVCLGYNAQSNSCLYCSYDYYNSKYLEHLSEIFPFHCLPKNLSTSSMYFSRQILIIKSNGLSCIECKTYFNATYHNLVNALLNESYFFSQVYQGSLTIFLSNEQHYILENEYSLYFFKKTAVKVIFKPFSCDFGFLGNFCLKNNEKVAVYVKTSYLTFFVSYSMIFQDIVFEGNDLLLQGTSSKVAQECLVAEKACCSENYFSNEYENNENLTNLCGLSKRFFSNSNAFEEEEEQFTNFFLIENIEGINYVPQIIFVNVTFRNFFVFRKNFKMLSLQTVGVKISWFNFLLTNCFFSKGIIYQTFIINLVTNATKQNSLFSQSFMDFQNMTVSKYKNFNQFPFEVSIFFLYFNPFKISFRNISFNEIENIGAKIYLFYFLGNADIEVLGLNIASSSLIQIVHIFYGNFLFDSIKVSNISNDNNLIQCFQSNISFTNAQFYLISGFQIPYVFNIGLSIIRVENVTFEELVNEVYLFYIIQASGVSIKNISISKFSNFINIFYFESLPIFQIQNIALEKISIIDSIFFIKNQNNCTFVNVLVAELDGKSIFRTLENDLLMILFFTVRESNFEHFFEKASLSYSINCFCLHFYNSYSEDFISGVQNYKYLNISNSYFASLIIHSSLYFMDYWNGKVFFSNNTFTEFTLLDSKLRVVFEYEQAEVYFISCKILFFSLPLSINAPLIGFWHATISVIENNFFYNKKTLNFGYLIFEDISKEVHIYNNKFYGFCEEKTNIKVFGFSSAGIPKAYFKNNVFKNLKCPGENSDIRVNNGAIGYFGFTTYSKRSNNFSVYLENDIFQDCSCNNGGSLGIVNVANVNLKNVSFINTRAYLKGGALIVFSCSIVNIENVFVQNASAEKASVFYLANTQIVNIYEVEMMNAKGIKSGSIEMKDCSLLYVSSLIVISSYCDKGGFLNILGGSLILTHSYFHYLYANFQGGLIFVYEKASIYINNIFTNMTTSNYSGGLIFCDYALDIVFSSSVIINSNSVFLGAAIFINELEYFELENCYFISGKCEENGLISFYSFNEDQNNLIKNCNFFFNEAKYGALVFFESASNLTLENIVCFFNKGHLFYLSWFFETYIKISRGNFSFNQKNENIGEGSIVISSKINLLFSDSSFYENDIDIFMMYLSSSIVILRNISFEEPILYWNKSFLMAPLSFALIESQSSQLFMEKCYVQIFQTFHKNISSGNYIFLYLEDTYFYMEDNFFASNNYSGPAKINGFFNYIVMNKTIFSNNAGPILEIYVLIIIIYECYFFQNFNLETISQALFSISNDISLLSVFAMVKCFINSTTGNNLINLNIAHQAKVFFCNFIDSVKILLIIPPFTNISIIGSLFYSIIGAKGSAIEVLASSQQLNNSIFVIENSFFVNCKSAFGGVLFYQGNINGSLKSNVFVNNSANIDLSLKNFDTGVGGVAALDCEINCKCEIKANLFIGNQAEYYAPTIYSTFNLSLIRNIFSDNKDFSNMTTKTFALPLSLQILEIDLLRTNNLSDYTFSSGHPINITLGIFDSLNQPIKYDSKSLIIFRPTLNQDSFLNTIKKLQNYFGILSLGQINIQNFTIISDPNTFNKLEIIVYYYNAFNRLTPTPIKANFYSRKCVIGEIFNFEGCFPCPQGFYSLKDPMEFAARKQMQKCEKCVKNAYCPGLNYFIPKEGFWRKSSKSLFIVSCSVPSYCIGLPTNTSLNEISNEIINNKSFFEENEAILLGSCSQGHEKNLCYECEPNYGKYVSSGFCSLCQEINYWLILRISFIIIFIMAYLYLNTQIFINQKQESSNFEIILKIIINHFQKINILCSDLINALEFQDYLEKLFSILETFSFLTENVFANDCFFQRLLPDPSDYYLYKVLFSLMLPFAMAFLFCIFFLVRKLINCLCKKANSPANSKQYYSFWKQILLVLLIALFLFYPLINSSCISLINCMSIDESNETYLRKAPNIQCWKAKHLVFFLSVGLSGFFIIGIGYPLFLWRLIYRQKSFVIKKKMSEITQKKKIWFAPAVKEITRPNNKKKKQIVFGSYCRFFYKDYKNSYYFWESIIFLLKFALTLLANINNLIYEEAQTLLMVILLFIYLISLIKLLPFEAYFINSLEIFSTCIAIFTKVCFVIYLNDFMLWPILFVIILNILFLFVSIFLIFRKTNWKSFFLTARKKITSFRSFLGRFFENFNSNKREYSSKKTRINNLTF